VGSDPTRVADHDAAGTLQGRQCEIRRTKSFEISAL
jgi:hypothetical protein